MKEADGEAPIEEDARFKAGYAELEDFILNTDKTEDDLQRLVDGVSLFNYWDRQSWEPEPTHIVFKFFLSLAPRSIPILAHMLTDPDTRSPIKWKIKETSARAKLQHWAKKYEWKQRAQAYDDYLSEVEREKYMLRRAASIGEQVALTDNIVRFLNGQFEQLIEEWKTQNIPMMSPSELMKWIKEYIGLQRTIFNLDNSASQTHDLMIKKEVEELGKDTLTNNDTEELLFKAFAERSSVPASGGSGDAERQDVDSGTPPSTDQ